MTSAYSVTINLPLELQDQLVSITSKYLNVIGDKKHIQCYEECKDGKKHVHIGYLSDPQKSTSNETRKFRECYAFSKKDHPNAIKHCKHNSWDLLIGYIAKSNSYPQLTTNLDRETVEQRLTEYKNLIPKVKSKKKEFYTVNEIYSMFTKYYQEQSQQNGKTNENRDYHLIHTFMSTIKTKILGTTWQRLNKDKLLEFAKFSYTPIIYNDYVLL